MNLRRRLLSALPLLGATAAGRVHASERFPGDPPEHKLVYQLNRADPDYIEHILNSVGAMIGKYADNISLAVVVFGPGVHLLARSPQRPVPQALRERASSQARTYGVRYIACGNTLKSLGWTRQDLLDFAQLEDVGAATLMELQEQGYAYIAW